MTRAQEILHWKRWSAVASANGWRMRAGRLAEEAAASMARSEQHKRVWVFAEQIALKNHRGVTPDDLRHATYCAGAGRDCTHTDMTNKEFNRVLSLWKMLADPDSIEAIMEWQHPAIAEKRGLISSIRRKAPESYIIEITRRKHGTADWETDLSMGALKQLAMTITNQSRRRRAEARVEEPF